MISLRSLLKNNKYKNIILTILGIILVFLIWTLISLSVNSSLFPTPDKAFIRFGEMFIDISTYEAIGGTLLRLLIALTISFIFSLLFGILAGLYDWIYRILNPLMIVLRTLPVAAIIYIMIVLLKPRYALFIITSLTMVPIMYEAFRSGIHNIDENIIDAVRLDSRVDSPRTIYKIMIPSAKESILLGIIQSLGLGMKVSLMAEILVGTNTIKGLGRLLYRGYIDLEIDKVLAVAMYAIILIGILDIALNFAKKKFKHSY